MKTIVLATVAGLASAAAAQGVTLYFDADGDITNGNAIAATGASWSVWAEFTGYADDSAYFGGFVGTILGNGDGTTSNAVNQMAGTGTEPTASDNDIIDINIFNAALLGTDDPTNPLQILTFDSSGSSSLTFTAEGVASVFPDDGIFALPDEYTNFTVVSDTLIPAPGALALLGLGGLSAARRRR